MRQIGVNQFAGEHPAIMEAMNEIHVEIAKAKVHRQEQFNKKTPAEKFLHLLNEKAEKPRAWNFDVQHHYWKVGNHTLIEIFPDEELKDIENGKDFLLHLNLLYVCDIHRGTGEGRKTMELLKQLSEDSGSVLTLVAAPFGYAPLDSDNPYSRNTWNELWQTVVDDEWEIVYLPSIEKELMTFFYKTAGLTNICLATEKDVDDEGKPEREGKNHFCHLPSSLDQKHRDKLEYRLNLDLCSWCKREK